MRLVSYAQRRTMKKRNFENTINHTYEDLDSKIKYSTSSTQLGFSKDLRTLREAKKAQRASQMNDEDLEREQMLFGDIQDIERERNTDQPASRNRLLNRNTVNYPEQTNDTFVDLQSINEDSDSGADFDEDIDEHDDIITPKTHDIKHKTDIIEKPKKEMPAVLKRALLNNQTGLEVIKEKEDIAPSPSKGKESTPVTTKAVTSKKTLFSPKTSTPASQNPVSTPTPNPSEPARGLKMPSRTTKPPSKLQRRHTVNLNPPTKLHNDSTIPVALNRLRQEPDQSPSSIYVTSSVNTKPTLASTLRKSENKSPKVTSPNSKFGFKGQAKQGQKSPGEKKEEEVKERKRKMMEERKMMLKKKLMAIRIQKFWKARQRRRRMILEHLRYTSAIRRIQRCFRRVYLVNLAKKRLLQVCSDKHLDKILKLQRAYRNYRSCPKKINVPRFKAILLATLQGWKVRRALSVLRNDEKTSEAIDVIKMYEDAKGKNDNLFFKQINEKYPEMLELFHTRFNELMKDAKWPERPIIKKKVIVSLVNNTFRHIRMY